METQKGHPFNLHPTVFHDFAIRLFFGEINGETLRPTTDFLQMK